jgi:hypothetical protein
MRHRPTRRFLLLLGRSTGTFGGLPDTVLYLLTAVAGAVGAGIGSAFGLGGAVAGLMLGGVLVLGLAAYGARLRQDRVELPSVRMKRMLDRAYAEAAADTERDEET